MGWELAVTQFVETLLLAVTNNRIVAYLAEPVRKRYPDLDLWWLQYVSLATGIAVGWFGGANMFGEVVADPLLGRILSSILVGGGSSLIHDIFDKQQ